MVTLVFISLGLILNHICVTIAGISQYHSALVLTHMLHSVYLSVSSSFSPDNYAKQMLPYAAVKSVLMSVSFNDQF